MNSLMQQQGQLLANTQVLRRDLLGALTDADLACRLPGRNVSLGELCREMGEIEHAYVEGFRTFKQSFDYQHADAGVTQSVAQLQAWFDALDAALQQALEGLSEDDLQRPVDRGYGFAPPAFRNFHIYREALLIFYAKADLYLKALNKQAPGLWRYWVGSRADWAASAE